MCTTELPFGRFVEIDRMVHIKKCKYLSFSKIDQIAIQWTTNLPNRHLADYTQTPQMEPELFRMHKNKLRQFVGGNFLAGRTPSYGQFYFN